MKSVTRRISIVAFLALFMCSAVWAQDRNSVTGFVFAMDGTPLQRVNVELQTELYTTISRTQTNGSGMYSFRGVPAGVYSIKVLPYGTDYEEQSKSVNLIPISVVAGRGAVAEQADFYLRAKKRAGDLHGAGGVVFAQEIPENAKKLYLAALEDLGKNRGPDGIAKLKQALEIFPDYYYALDRLGSEYLGAGHFAAARILFANALRVNQRSISSGLGLGVANFRLNDISKAMEAFDAVLKLDKENVNALYWKGIVLHSSQRHAEAVSALRKAVQLSGGKFPDAHFQLARVYKDQSKFKESADELETFLKLRPDADNAAEIRRIITTLRNKPNS